MYNLFYSKSCWLLKECSFVVVVVVDDIIVAERKIKIFDIMWSCLLRMPSKGCLNFWVAFVFRCIFFLFRFELVHPKFYTWCLKFLDIGHFGILLYWWFTWYQFYSTWYVKRFRRRLMWCIITKTGTSLYFSIFYFIFILFFHLFLTSLCLMKML